MAIKPILFNIEMVRAILEGRKTQTRRIIKGIPLRAPYFEVYDGKPMACDPDGDWFPLEQFSLIQPGDILWVRETWRTETVWQGSYIGYEIAYKAGGKETFAGFPPMLPSEKGVWHPSIHMPKEAARIFLRVVNIRAEKLQTITKEDALAEGADEIESWGGRGDFIKLADYTISNYAKIWDKTVRKADLPRYGWAANPWVWVIEFERTEQKTPF